MSWQSQEQRNIFYKPYRHQFIKEKIKKIKHMFINLQPDWNAINVIENGSRQISILKHGQL